MCVCVCVCVCVCYIPDDENERQENNILLINTDVPYYFQRRAEEKNTRFNSNFFSDKTLIQPGFSQNPRTFSVMEE